MCPQHILQHAGGMLYLVDRQSRRLPGKRRLARLARLSAKSMIAGAILTLPSALQAGFQVRLVEPELLRLFQRIRP